MNPATDASWHLKYRSQIWLDKLRLDFMRRFEHYFDDPEDVCSTATERLLFKRLPVITLKHQDNTDAFVLVAFRSIVKDLMREHHGRTRVPALLKQMGKPYTEIFFEFCLRQFSAGVIAERLSLPLNSVKVWVQWLKAEDKCPRKTITVSLTGADPNEPLTEMEVASEEPFDAVEQAIDSERLQAVIHWLFSSDREALNSATNKRTVLESKLEQMPKPPLNDELRELLRLIYWEGNSLAETARILGDTESRVKRRRNKTLDQLRRYFSDHDIFP